MKHKRSVRLKMIEEKREDSVPAEVIWLHMDELIQKGMSEYRVFDMLAGLTVPAADIDGIRRILIELVELNIAEQLNLGEEIGAAARKLLQRSFQPGKLLFQTWWDCLEAVKPERKLLKQLVTDFDGILDQVKPFSREYIEFLPLLYKSFGSQAEQVMRSLSAILTNEVPSEQISDFLAFLELYIGFSPYELFSAILQVGAVMAAADASIQAEFKEICNPDVLQENREAQRFVLALGSNLEKFPGANRHRLLRLGLLVALSSLSSASFVQSKIEVSMGKLPAESKAAYLDALFDIISHAGIGLVGFCLGDLADLFAAHPQKTRDYAQVITAIAARYGPQAASCFVGKKTAAAKDYIEKVFH